MDSNFEWPGARFAAVLSMLDFLKVPFKPSTTKSATSQTEFQIKEYDIQLLFINK